MKAVAGVKIQRFKIERHIREHGSMNTFQARDMGIMHPSARVQELKDSGLNIVSHLMTITDSEGVEHPRVAVYTLDKSL